MVPFKVRFFFKSIQYTEPTCYELNNEIFKRLFHILKNIVDVYTSTLTGTAKPVSVLLQQISLKPLLIKFAISACVII